MFDEIVAQLSAIDAAAMTLDRIQDTAAGVNRVRAALDALEARLLTAAADRTFDPAAGLEMLRAGGGCSQREARRRLRRAEALDQMPAVADALAAGDITAEHADALAQAARTTSAETVNDDTALLEKTKTLPADLAAREATDWAHRRQTEADREAKFRRQRQLRSHRTWSDSEGMINFRTRLDPVTGAQARAVIDDISNRLYRADGGRDAKADQTRTWTQRNADAFAAALGINPIPGIETGAQAATAPGPATKPVPAGPIADDRRDTGSSSPSSRPRASEHNPESPGPMGQAGGWHGGKVLPPRGKTAPVTGPAGRDNPQQPATRNGQNGPQPSAGTRRLRENRPPPSLRNQILVIAHTDAITGADPDARCEIPGTGPIPRSELERLACEAELFGALFDGNGLPLWHGRRTRTVTPQQWRMLIARDRGCVLCAASPGHCHAHHIIPWTAPAEGPTDIDNLVLVCNRHHHHIHQHNLTLTRAPDGQWTTHTPTGRNAGNSPNPGGRTPNTRKGQAPPAGSPVTIRAGP